LLAAVAAMAHSRAMAATADRFVPTDPAFVVANITQSLPDEALRRLLERWRAAPDAEEPVLALAEAFVDRARARREPRYFGRAEALLETPARRPGAGAGLRRLYAETLQFRHAFAPAEGILDELLREQPHDAETRLRRASLRLTRGDFPGARSDCAQLTLARGAIAPAGFACLAEALAGGGELGRARLLLDAMAQDSAALDAGSRAYLLTTRAELAERAGDLTGAIADYRRASALAPQDDAIRAALADALIIAGGADAGMPLVVENPSLALLVRRAAIARDALLMGRARDWLALELARGDAIHHREAAMLALAERRPADALAEARLNFEVQRELADVRVFARAAIAARDLGAQEALRQWLASTGFEDTITTAILAGKPGG
jgi:thioredoxin-like negative regulator of GroEL